MVVPRDTDADAWSRLIRAYRAMGPQERLRLALTMTDELHEIARSGLRARHPEWAADQVEEALEELLLGVELARTARQSRIALSR